MNGHFTLSTLSFVALYALCTFAPAMPQAREVALRQMVLSSDQEARQVRAGLIAGASFETVAAEKSRDASAQHGGYMGRMRLSDLRDEVRKAIETVAPGGITDPVPVGNTYVLFQVVPEAESRWIDLDEAGAQALADGRIAEATSQFEQALAQAEAAALGDARLARSLDSLAGAYRLESRSVDAERLYRRALALLERMGAPDLEVAQVLSGLGTALVKQARFAEAQPLYERARSIREKRLGPNHPEVAATARNIAEVLAGQGRFVDAAKLYDQSQVMLERALGDSHPATVAAAEGLQIFRKSLIPELLERISTAAMLADFHDRDSITAIRELLPFAPLSERAFGQIKDVLMDSALQDDAADVLRDGLAKFPDSRLLRIYAADVLAATGRTQDALAILQEAGRLPQTEGLGIVFQRTGDMQAALTDFDGALASYRRALEIDSALPETRIKMGRAYLSAGRLQEGIAELERAVRETPDNGDANLNLTEAYVAAGQWERAVTAAQRAIELRVSDSRALYLLGTALIRTGRREQGQERLQEFAGVEAGFEEAAQRSREINGITITAAEAVRTGNNDSAAAALTRGIARYTDVARLHMNLAIVQSRLGRHEMAIDILESMLKRGVGRAFLIHKMLATEYEIVGNIEAGRRNRKIYLETREAELLMSALQ
jgi:tetratricopeptide (TPR) repeat protein